MAKASARGWPTSFSREAPPTSWPASMGATGTVYLVGAGPGDPGLITVRGLELLRRADVLVYDRLVNARLLAEAPQEAERVYVGRSSGQAEMEQDPINTLMIAPARSGRTVVRLKGG